MKKTLFVAFAALALSVALQGADVWKSKSVAEWTREETLQFFRNSPWVRSVSVGAGVARSDPSALSRSPFGGPGLSGNVCPSCTGVELPRESPTAAGSGIESSSGTGGRGGGVYLIQWTSARIVRQAFAHLLALQGQGSPNPETAPLDVYVVTVGGPDLQAFEGIEEPELRNEAWLRPKKSKVKVSASRINVLRADDGRISVVHFGFPREQDGKAVISETEKAVEFHCRVRDKTLKAEFNLRTMVLQGNRDL